MAMKLSGKQSWLTRSGRVLEEAIEKHASIGKEPSEHQAAELQRIREAHHDIKFKADQLDKALDNFLNAADEMEAINDDWRTRSEQTINAAQELSIRAQERLAELSWEIERRSNSEQSERNQDRPSLPNLAPLPIPKFRGQLWEWDHFWGIFEPTIHKRNITNIEKLNYLLEALQGPAKDTIRELQITADNYDVALQLLRKKYDNREAVVSQLLQQLETMQMKSNKIVDQVHTLEKILPIVAQLEQKGENTNILQMRRTVLAKFSDKVQRSMLKKKAESSADNWTTQQLLKDLQDYFSTETQIQQFRGAIHEHEEDPKLSATPAAKKVKQIRSDGARTSSCFYCGKDDHKPVSCPKYSTIEQRLEVIRQKELCRNCGSGDHCSKSCTRGACRQCNTKGHHTSICRKPFESQSLMPRSAHESSQRAQPHTQAVRKATVSQNVATVVNMHNSTSCKIDNHTILRQPEFPRMAQRPVDLLVGQARVWNVRLQEFEDVNMILDTGAEQSFITNDYADHLGLGISGQMNLMIHTFGTASPTEKTCNTTKVEIEDRHGTRHNFELARIDFITGDVKRTALPALDRQYLREHDIQLSISPQIREIQTPILLGCGDLFTLFDHGLGAQHHLPSGLQLLHSRIGYLVAGRNNSARKRSEVQLNTIRSRSVDDKAEQLQWDHYWNVDSAGIEEFTGPQTQELRAINEKVWEQFRTTVERHDDGYYVRLPWKDSANDLPDNRALAYNRLRNIHSKIKSQPDLLLQYHNTFREQLEKGVIEEVDETAKPDGKIVHYLAHHAVLTPHKDTTKLRIVFDGSAHYKNAPCLNDKLHQGAVILPSLTDMLLRFRAGNIAIISDVEKAFLQVHLQIQDRDATRCLWIRDISKPVKTDNIVTYRFTRVLFGLNCSPFLLGATIIEHLDHIDDREMADLIKNNVYVDNLLMTATTPAEALERLQKARQIFTEINMNLREFRTNSEEVNDRIPPDKLSKSIIPKVLGLQWNSAEDTITITCCYPDKTTITKRTVSEQISSIYDPFGWLTPLTLNAKLFQQNIWKFNYKWDEELSEAHQNEWKRILARSHGFTKSIIRKVSDGSKTSTARLVAFADASRQAMAACVYLVNNGSQELLVAKSKLPPIKSNFTIPKLEMNALTLAARLAHNTLRALESQLCVKSITIYSDSEVALAWLASSDISNKAGVLVRNRCMEIRKINDDMIRKGIEVKFGHVNTDLNPADCATRGLWKEDLETHPWWNGPSFIAGSYDQWLAASSLPDRKSFDEVGQVEMQRNILHTTAANQQDSVKEIVNWKRYSSVNHAVSVFSYALRWLNRIISRVQPDLRDSILEHIPQLKKRHDDEFPTVPERRDALTLLIRNYQQVHVEKNIEPTKDRLIPFQDTNGLIRCRGRLRNSELSDECKQPILLTANTTFATLVIQDAHSKFHLGTAHTMAEVRTHYWIPQLRRQVQKVIRRCVPCQRMNNLPYRYPELPDLPSRRVVRSRPFQHVGIDYFGPITVKSNEESDKAYGVIITCTTTRLIHLECVTDMSTVQLLDALRRFFARRGVPETITSDNAQYFSLGDQILRDAASASVANTTVAATMATNGIAWKMITPYAPWQGAFYERLIKIIKHSLIKTIGKKVLSLGGLTTLLTEIEGILNTRPLTYQEDCWEDRPTLRPIDFIQRDMNITYPMDGLDPSADDPDYYPPEESFQLRTRAQAIEALHSSCQFTERFWKIWSEEYLTALREQHTRHLALKNDTPKVPTPGTVVLLVDPNLPRNTWKIGRITKLNPSKDNAIREVELILPNRRTTRRPINLLVPLELDGCAEEHIDFQQQAEESIDTRKPTTHPYNLRRRNRTNNNMLLSSTFTTVIYAMALIGIATSVSNPTCPHESYDEILDLNIPPSRNPPSYSPRQLMETAHVSTILPIISNLYPDRLIPISLPSQLIRNDLYSSYPARVLHIRQSTEKAPTTQMQNCASQKRLNGNQELERTSFTSKSLSECLISKITSEQPEQKKSNGTDNNTNNFSTNKKTQPCFSMDSRSSELLPREYSDRALSTTNSNDDMEN